MTDISPETARAVLAVTMDDRDSGAKSIREYLTKLLRLVWEDGEGFDGKRPFGNSGWDWDVYAALGKAGLIAATFDEDGYLEDLDGSGRRFGDQLILAAIDEMGAAS